MNQNEIKNPNELLLMKNKKNSKTQCLSIQLPKILSPCVDEICRMTRRNRDDLFTHFVIYGLAGFYQEPEVIYNFTKKIPNFSERLRKGLNQCYGKDYFRDKRPVKYEDTMVYNSTDENRAGQPQSDKELNNNMQNIEFTLMISDILLENFNIFSEITNRTNDYLAKMFIIDQLAFIYQNPELIYDYIKDSENLMEPLRTGLNLVFGRNHFKKKVNG